MTNTELANRVCDGYRDHKPFGVTMGKDGCALRVGGEQWVITSDQAERVLLAIPYLMGKAA